MQVCPRCGAHAGDGLRFCTSCGTSLQAVAPTEILSGPSCARCGAALAPGLRFCTACGTPIAPAPAPPPPPPPPPLERGTTRRRGPLILAAVLVLVLAAGSGAAAWWLTRDDGSTTATDRRADERENDTGDDTEPEPDATVSESSAPSSPTPSASTAPPAPTDGARCWDGSGAPTVEDCPYPSGRAGLEWVFPSMAGQDCTDVKAATGSPRVEFWECFAFLDDGTEVRLNYSQFGSIGEGYSHFEAFLGEPEEVTNRFDELALYRWNGIVEGEYERAVMDAREPFSVAVFAPSAEQREEAFEQLVTLRPGTQFLGVPTG